MRTLARIGIAPELVHAAHRLFSALHFADPTFRKVPEGNGAPDAGGSAWRPRKEALWGRGISGDFPILLLRVGDVGAPLLREAVVAQRYLRSCGFAFDLLLIDEQPSGYVTDSAGTLRSALAQLQAAEWINKRGGVYVLSMDQIGHEEYGRLESTARVVLDTRDGSLDVCMARRREAPPKLPRFSATLSEDAPPLVPARPPLAFDNGLGGVTEDGREYVIAVTPGQPTPAPWCNVLANPDFGCIVSESSLGSTWSVNASENRLTPWRNDPVFDTPSEVLYLRDEETAAIWSSTPLPAGGDAATQVVHGAGYTRYLRESHGLEEELTVFVPPSAPLKIARLRLRNKLPRHRRLTATYYAEWVFGNQREVQRAYVESSFDRTHACLLATCAYSGEFGDRVAFLASELDVHGFTADRVEFLGRPGDYAHPEALARWGLSGRIERAADPCAALQVHLELDAVGSGHDEIVTHFVLGQAPSRTEALELVTRFRDGKAVSAAWEALAIFWDDLLGTIRVRTPEPAMDVMLNRWLLYQCVAARLFGRTAFYQSSGALGFRDQLQDVLALVHAAPERVRAHVLEAAAHQFEEGDVLHWWHPPSGRGVRTRCSDDMVWLTYVTANYVSATGDASVLEERIPFLAGEPLRHDEHDRYAEFARSQDAGTLLEHCRRALHRALTQGRHGLPLMGDGDWNDGMNKVGAEGKGESVWLAWFLCTAMNSFATMCERLQGEQGKDSKMEAASWRSRADELRSKIEACAWDGRWYLRAFHDDGSVLGSQADRECCIDSIAQSWAVLSGVADESRARRPAARPAVRHDAARSGIHPRVPAGRPGERWTIHACRYVARVGSCHARGRRGRDAHLPVLEPGASDGTARRLRALPSRALCACGRRVRLFSVGGPRRVDLVHGGGRVGLPPRNRGDSRAAKGGRQTPNRSLYSARMEWLRSVGSLRGRRDPRCRRKPEWGQSRSRRGHARWRAARLELDPAPASVGAEDGAANWSPRSSSRTRGVTNIASCPSRRAARSSSTATRSLARLPRPGDEDERMTEVLVK